LFLKALFVTVVFLSYCEDSQAQALAVPGYRSGTLYYYFHTIKKDETLIKIAKIYNLSVSEILEVNSAISDPEKISEGQKIKVPNYSHFIDKYPHDQWNFILYRIKQGDRLKSIAKEFKTDVDDIKNVNPGIENKPVTGAEIRVPVKKQGVAQNPDKNRELADKKEQDKKEQERKKQEENEQDKQPFKNPALTFNWGNDNSKSEENRNFSNTDCAEYSYKSGTVFKISLIAPLKKDDGTIDLSGTSFLSGALIAVNEMKNNGLTVKLNSFDAGGKNSISRILRSQELKESDVIIAQAPVDYLAELAGFASENRIHLVIPNESKAHALVENNPYVIQLYPSVDVVCKKMMSKQYNEDVLPVLVKPEKPDSAMLKMYRTELKKRFGTFKEQTHKMGLRELAYRDILDMNKLNLIFVCPTAEASRIQPFVSDLISRLNTVKHRLSVFGTDNWSSFELIEKTLYFNTNVHLAKPLHVDYSNDAVKLFVQLYRKAYNNEPEKYAFLGHDVMYYFLSVLRKYGSDFKDCVSGFDSILLQSRYKLRRNNLNGGFVNDGCFLMEYTRDDIEIRRE
jgi:LysM repeat protein